MNRFQYTVLMVACVVVTLPLEFLFGARVWRRPRRLVKALLPVVAVFVAWDVWAVQRGTWSFDHRYIIGWTLPGGVAVEEILFFVVVPVCGLLTLEAFATSWPARRRCSSGGGGADSVHIYPLLAISAAIVVAAVELCWFRSGLFRTKSYWLTMAISIGFMVVVDGWLTKRSAPVVRYDDHQTSGLRPIWDILIEEYAYAFALLTMVMLLWDRSDSAEPVEMSEMVDVAESTPS